VPESLAPAAFEQLLDIVGELIFHKLCNVCPVKVKRI
jgi:hypothetical protein